MAGWSRGFSGPCVLGQLTLLLEVEACAGRARQWYLNSWGYWVLYAKAGQIFLNVTGRVEAELAQDRGAGGFGGLGWSGALGRISVWEEAQCVKPSEEARGGGGPPE